MIKKLQNITPAQLNNISNIIGEAFVTNEMFHNWGSVEERHDDVNDKKASVLKNQKPY